MFAPCSGQFVTLEMRHLRRIVIFVKFTDSARQSFEHFHVCQSCFEERSFGVACMPACLHSPTDQKSQGTRNKKPLVARQASFLLRFDVFQVPAYGQAQGRALGLFCKLWGGVGGGGKKQTTVKKNLVTHTKNRENKPRFFDVASEAWRERRSNTRQSFCATTRKR